MIICLTSSAVFFTLSAGSVLLVLILFKYIKTRRLTMRHAYRSPWWASHDSKSASRSRETDVTETGATVKTTTSEPISARQSTYDRALVTRFTLGFVILALVLSTYHYGHTLTQSSFFEVAIILFTLFQSSNNASIAAAGHPNHTVSGAVTDICLFIPGASISLVVFLVFGTTKSWRQYWDMVIGGCGARSKLENRSLRRRSRSATEQSVRMDTFERLPSPTTDGPNAPKSIVATSVPLDSRFDFGFEGPGYTRTATGNSDSSDDEALRLPIQSPDDSVVSPHRLAQT